MYHTAVRDAGTTSSIQLPVNRKSRKQARSNGSLDRHADGRLGDVKLLSFGSAAA